MKKKREEGGRREGEGVRRRGRARGGGRGVEVGGDEERRKKRVRGVWGERNGGEGSERGEGSGGLWMDVG